MSVADGSPGFAGSYDEEYLGNNTFRRPFYAFSSASPGSAGNFKVTMGDISTAIPTLSGRV